MTVYEIGLLAAGLNLLINYAIGKPASDKFSPYEIFSGYTVWLSVWRLEKEGLIKDYHQQFQENINRIHPANVHECKNLKKDYQKILYEAADPYFTWERAIGMCPVCTGVWVALFSGLVFTQNFLNLIIIVIVSHITIRILNRIT